MGCVGSWFMVMERCKADDLMMIIESAANPAF